MSTKGWRTKEARSAKRHRARRIGGSGRPDYTRGCIHGEVKHRKSKVTKPEILRTEEKGRRRGACKIEIVSSSGYTKPAKEYAKRHKEKVNLLRK